MILLPKRYERIPTAISAGGMSTAHVCNDKDLNRKVLIKELHDGVEPRRLSDEVAALASIRSKHVVQLYDVIRDSSDNIVGLVEEYLPGDDLNSIIPVSDLDTFMRTAYAVACGLADVHAAGCIHRDIKPGNMKFDAERCLKIFDFGLARISPADAATQGAIGTRGYMAPELCVDEGDEARFTAAVDTYAFGATALKLLRSSLPLEMRQLPSAIPAEADFDHQSVSLSPDVAAVLNACFARRPSKRPPMAQVRDVIGTHLLRDKHRAILVARNGTYDLGAHRRAVRVSLGTLGSLDLSYDGLHFRVIASTGQVFVNNVAVSVPHTLPGACVITVGGPEEGARRAHITVDVSHPEVVL